MEKLKNIMAKCRVKKNQREKAQAMVVSFIYISVVALIAVYMMSYAQHLHRVVVREVKHSMSFYAGEGALIRAMTLLIQGRAVPGAMNTNPMTIGVTTTAIGGNTTRITANVNWP